MCDIYLYMRRIEKIYYITLACLAMLVAMSCSNENDSVLTQQQTNIDRYLKNSHSPRLINEEEIAQSLEEEPQFYTRWGLDIYRYIATYYDEGRQDKPEIGLGTTFDITYTAYIFTGNKPKVQDMYATNDEASIEELKKLGLNTSYEWTTDPMRITLGETKLLSGLETALQGCREDDEVEIYLTYEAANGKHYVGKVPSKSPVMWMIKIVNVE